jgi:hypothetical protein
MCCCYLQSPLLPSSSASAALLLVLPLPLPLCRFIWCGAAPQPRHHRGRRNQHSQFRVRIFCVTLPCVVAGVFNVVSVAAFSRAGVICVLTTIATSLRSFGLLCMVPQPRNHRRWPQQPRNWNVRGVCVPMRRVGVVFCGAAVSADVVVVAIFGLINMNLATGYRLCVLVSPPFTAGGALAFNIF